MTTPAEPPALAMPSGAARGWWLALVAGAAAINFGSLQLVGDVALPLGGWLGLPLVLVGSVRSAVLAAGLGSASTWVGLGHPVMALLAPLEALWLAWARGRWQVRPALWQATFWTAVGGPLGWLWLVQVTGWPRDLAGLAMVALGAQQVLALAVADFAVRFTPLGARLRSEPVKPTRLREAVFHYVFILTAVPLALMALAISLGLQQRAEMEDQRSLSEGAQQAAQDLATFVQFHRSAVATAARLASQTGTPEAVVLEELRRAFPGFITLLTTDAEGGIQAVAPGDLGARWRAARVADRSYFRVPRDTLRPYTSGVFRGRVLGDDVLVAVSAPVLGANGEFRGVVEGSVEVQKFARVLARRGREPDVLFTLADATGRVIHADADTGLRSLDELTEHAHAGFLTPEGRVQVHDLTDAQGERRRYRAHAALSPDGTFLVIAQRPVLGDLPEAGPVLAGLGLLAAGVLGAALCVTRLGQRQLARPLEAFARSAEQQAETGSVAPIPLPAARLAHETGQVYSAFNHLAARLLETLRELRESNAVLDQRVVERTRELEEARQVAEAASRSKSDFLSMTSHEIRTPLNAIIGLAEVLREGGCPPAMAARLATIHRSGMLALEVVNDLLDLASAEAGRIALRPEPTELCTLVREVGELLALRATQKGLTLRWDVPPTACWVHVDPQRLRQVLLNLATNAVKFTAIGEVVMTLRVEPTLVAATGHPEARERERAASPDEAARGADAADDPDTCQVELAVRDTGPGIPREKQARLGEAFYRVPSAGAEAIPGTGLGLAISRRLVALLGGQWAFRSEVGRGTEFSFALRCRRAEARAPVAAEGRAASGEERPPAWIGEAREETSALPGALPPVEVTAVAFAGGASAAVVSDAVLLAGLRVIAADDNAANREVLAALLEGKCAQVEIVDGGEALLARLGQETFDIALVDWDMPGCGGREVAARVAAAGADHASCGVRLVLASALARAQLEELSAGTGFVAVVEKPINRRELLRVLADQARLRSAARGVGGWLAAGPAAS